MSKRKFNPVFLIDDVVNRIEYLKKMIKIYSPKIIYNLIKLSINNNLVTNAKHRQLLKYNLLWIVNNYDVSRSYSKKSKSKNKLFYYKD